MTTTELAQLRDELICDWRPALVSRCSMCNKDRSRGANDPCKCVQRCRRCGNPEDECPCRRYNGAMPGEICHTTDEGHQWRLDQARYEVALIDYLRREEDARSWLGSKGATGPGVDTALAHMGFDLDLVLDARQVQLTAYEAALRCLRMRASLDGEPTPQYPAGDIAKVEKAIKEQEARWVEEENKADNRITEAREKATKRVRADAS